jgi:hypothetical protein
MANTKHKNENFSSPRLRASFDSLQYVKRLEAVGVPRAQAEVQAEIFLSVMEEQLVTKYDIKELEGKISLELEIIRRDIKELEVKLSNQTELLRRDLKIWFGGMLITLVASLSGIATLTLHLSGH